jgi:hypothetical protein
VQQQQQQQQQQQEEQQLYADMAVDDELARLHRELSKQCVRTSPPAFACN